MLVGSADPARLAERAPQLDAPATEPVTLEGVEILQLLYEIDAREVTELFPPALHPTLPPIATFVFYKVSGGPFGPFELAQLRLGCRSGLRPRALLVGSFVDSPRAGAELTARWGFACRPAEVRLRRYYDEVEGTVTVDGATILSGRLRDPEMISAADVQYTANLNPARLDRGFRLVQVDSEFQLSRAERGRPALAEFTPSAWGDERIRPATGVSGSFAIGDVVLPRVRYVCRADVWAFDGTEQVAERDSA